MKVEVKQRPRYDKIRIKVVDECAKHEVKEN